MMARLKSLLLVVSLVAFAETATAAPGTWTDQSGAVVTYLQGIPRDGVTLVWNSPATAWTNLWGTAPNFEGFLDNLAFTLTRQDWGDPATNLFNDLTVVFPEIVTLFQTLSDAQAAKLILELQVLGFSAEKAAQLVAACRSGAAGGLTMEEAQQLVAMLRGAGAAGAAAERQAMEDAVHQSIGGFSPFSAPVIVSRGLMKGHLRAASPVAGSAWGVNTWMQNSQLDEGVDTLSLGGQPYMRKVKNSLTWSVSAPLLYANFEDINDDDQWSGGFDGTVEYSLDNGIFVGMHGAFLNNYAEMLEKDNFLSLSGGPYAGMTYTVDEKLAFTAMALTEGISTQRTDDTWYVAGGGGVSYRVTKAVTFNLFGLYYSNMDTYTKEEDRDFMEVGLSAEAAIAKDTAVIAEFSNIFFSQHLHSYTLSLNFAKGF